MADSETPAKTSKRFCLTGHFWVVIHHRTDPGCTNFCSIGSLAIPEQPATSFLGAGMIAM